MALDLTGSRIGDAGSVVQGQFRAGQLDNVFKYLLNTELNSVQARLHLGIAKENIATIAHKDDL